MLVVALGVVACGDDDEEVRRRGLGRRGVEGHAAACEGDGKDLVLFTMTASNVYGANQIKGAQEEAEKLGYKLTVFQNNFSQPEQDQQVQQYIASGAKPAAAIIFAVGRRRRDQRRAPALHGRPGDQITQEPNEQSWPFVKAYAGANQILIGQIVGEMLLKAREDAAQGRGMKFKSQEGNLLVFQHPEGEKTGTERWKGFEEATKDAPFNVIAPSTAPTARRPATRSAAR